MAILVFMICIFECTCTIYIWHQTFCIDIWRSLWYDNTMPNYLQTIWW